MRHRFDRIRVNELRQLYDGKLVGVSDVDERARARLNLKKTEAVPADKTKVSTAIGDLYVGSVDYLQAYPAVSSGQVSFSWRQRGSAALSSRIDNAYRITVGVLAAGQEDDLQAVVQVKGTAGRDSSVTIGQCRVIGYPAKTIPLYLIPVGETASYDQQAIASTLNDIYRQAVISWQVQWLPPFVTSEWDVEGKGTFINSDANTRMDYTSSMRALIRAYKKANDVESHAVYVFLINLPCSDASLRGFMPFNKQFGFVFVPAAGTDAASLSHTLAHEAAHGTFNLRHTFSSENNTPFIGWVISQNTSTLYTESLAVWVSQVLFHAIDYNCFNVFFFFFTNCVSLQKKRKA